MPFRRSRAQIAAEHRARVDDVRPTEDVFIATPRPVFDGLLRPLVFSPAPQFDPDLPPGYLSGYVYVDPDARSNLEAVRQQLQPVLGEPVRHDSSNTFGYRWAAGPARVDITCWPPELRNPGQVSLEREPRLAVACHVVVIPGLRTTLSSTERAWLDDYRPAVRLPAPPTGDWDPIRTPPGEYDAEFVREPEGDVDRYAQTIGMVTDSQASSALIYCAHQLIVVPAAAIEQFELHRVRPARGSGGSYLHLSAATGLPQPPPNYPDGLSLYRSVTTKPPQPSNLKKRLNVAEHTDPEGLTEFAGRLSDLTGIELTILPDAYDE